MRLTVNKFKEESGRSFVGPGTGSSYSQPLHPSTVEYLSQSTYLAFVSCWQIKLGIVNKNIYPDNPAMAKNLLETSFF